MASSSQQFQQKLVSDVLDHFGNESEREVKSSGTLTTPEQLDQLFVTLQSKYNAHHHASANIFDDLTNLSSLVFQEKYAPILRRMAADFIEHDNSDLAIHLRERCQEACNGTSISTYASSMRNTTKFFDQFMLYGLAGATGVSIVSVDSTCVDELGGLKGQLSDNKIHPCIVDNQAEMVVMQNQTNNHFFIQDYNDTTGKGHNCGPGAFLKVLQKKYQVYHDASLSSASQSTPAAQIQSIEQECELQNKAAQEIIQKYTNPTENKGFSPFFQLPIIRSGAETGGAMDKSLVLAAFIATLDPKLSLDEETAAIQKQECELAGADVSRVSSVSAGG